MENPESQDLYDLLVTHDFDPLMKDSMNQDTTDPSKAKMFTFDYKTENENYGTVVALITPKNELQIYFGDNLGRSMEGEDRGKWYDFLEQLKNFAVTHSFMTFQPADISRLKYTMQGMAAIKEGLFESYYGKKDVSYSDQPKKTRLMIKHSRNIGEGEVRYRAIESLFVETSDGQRFRVPSRNLMHGKLLARHCAEGGNPYDIFGQHINGMMTEMQTLSRFVRAARGRQFDEGTQELVGRAVHHYNDLKDKAKRMIGQRGYHDELTKFDPSMISDSELTAESIRNMFIEQSIDQRIEEALPILAKLANQNKEPEMKEINEFENWTNNIVEGTWALPETPQQIANLKKLMSSPLIVGADANNATEQLYDLVGDDQLFDRLGDLAERDANANCWDDPAVMDRLSELGIDAEVSNSDDEMDEGYYKDPDGDEDPADQADQADYNRRGREEDGMDEGAWDTAKKVGSKVLDKLGGGNDEDLIRDLQRRSGMPQTGLKPSEDPNFKTRSDVMAKQLARQNPGDPAGNFGKGGKELGIFKEDSCNMTPAGESCSVHGVDECWSYPTAMEDLDTDGVMMTQASNMSSESLERIKKLALIN